MKNCKLNLTTYLLICLIEECAEVIQRVCKAIRFGLYEKQNTTSGQSEATNAERIIYEADDLETVKMRLYALGVFPQRDEKDWLGNRSRKLDKMERYEEYARSQGTLE